MLAASASEAARVRFEGSGSRTAVPFQFARFQGVPTESIQVDASRGDAVSASSCGESTLNLRSMPCTLSAWLPDADASKPLAQFVLAFKGLLAFLFFEGMANFGARTRRDHILQPVLFGRLLAGGDDFDLVATGQRLTQRAPACGSPWRRCIAIPPWCGCGRRSRAAWPPRAR